MHLIEHLPQQTPFKPRQWPMGSSVPPASWGWVFDKSWIVKGQILRIVIITHNTNIELIIIWFVSANSRQTEIQLAQNWCESLPARASLIYITWITISEYQESTYGVSDHGPSTQRSVIPLSSLCTMTFVT